MSCSVDTISKTLEERCREKLEDGEHSFQALRYRVLTRDIKLGDGTVETPNIKLQSNTVQEVMVDGLFIVSSRKPVISRFLILKIAFLSSSTLGRGEEEHQRSSGHATDWN